MEQEKLGNSEQAFLGRSEQGNRTEYSILANSGNKNGQLRAGCFYIL
jgi:hypothetical protein